MNLVSRPPTETSTECLDPVTSPVSEDAKNAGGEPIWDVMERHLRDVKVVKAVKLNEPIIKGVKNNPGMVSL